MGGGLKYWEKPVLEQGVKVTFASDILTFMVLKMTFKCQNVNYVNCGMEIFLIIFGKYGV